MAGEVRKLAQRGADAAAKEIKGLIADSVAKVEDGGKRVEQSGKTLQETVTCDLRRFRGMGRILIERKNPRPLGMISGEGLCLNMF